MALPAGRASFTERVSAARDEPSQHNVWRCYPFRYDDSMNTNLSPRSSTMVCPTCGRKFLLDETPTPPFCSQRCQMIDLGRWLDEDIGLPHEGDPGETPVEHRGEEE